MNIVVLAWTLILCIINCFNGFVGYIPIQKAEAAIQQVQSVEVPILMFHHFVLNEEECSSGSIITKDKFIDVLDEIEEMGYTTISFRELIEYAQSGVPLPDKPILITIDDGYKSNYDIAYPELKERDMKALVSIIGRSTQYTSNYIENKTLPHVSWDELNEMIQSGVFEVGNHTYDLHKMREYGGERDGVTKNFFESEATYFASVREDIASLEESLKLNCNYENDVFCYPYGFYDSLSEATISSLGYKVTLTTDEGINYIKPGDELIGLKRINVEMCTDIKNYLS